MASGLGLALGLALALRSEGISKRAMELMAHCYHHLWKMPTTIVRFFNVYGPHGRPDMMPWQWTLDILAGKPLTLYNAGRIKRDGTSYRFET